MENQVDDKEFKVVNITVQRYKELLKAESILKALFAAGVDNWEGYGEANS